jgi:hypothetical protein
MRLPLRAACEAWFDFKGSDRYQVDEESFLLPNEEVLTILKLPGEALP